MCPARGRSRRPEPPMPQPGGCRRQSAPDAQRLAGVGDELARAAVALLGLLGECPRERGVERGWKAGTKLARRRRCVVKVRIEDGDLRGIGKRRLSRQALVEHAPERVDVGTAVKRLTADLLRRNVVERPDELAGLGGAGA